MINYLTIIFFILVTKELWGIRLERSLNKHNYMYSWDAQEDPINQKNQEELNLKGSKLEILRINFLQLDNKTLKLLKKKYKTFLDNEEESIKEIEEVFEKVDYNRDGKINCEEFSKVLRYIFNKLESPPLSEEEVQGIFNGLDGNQDGFIDKEKSKEGVIKAVESAKYNLDRRLEKEGIQKDTPEEKESG